MKLKYLASLALSSIVLLFCPLVAHATTTYPGAGDWVSLTGDALSLCPMTSNNALISGVLSVCVTTSGAGPSIIAAPYSINEFCVYKLPINSIDQQLNLDLFMRAYTQNREATVVFSFSNSKGQAVGNYTTGQTAIPDNAATGYWGVPSNGFGNLYEENIIPPTGATQFVVIVTYVATNSVGQLIHPLPVEKYVINPGYDVGQDGSRGEQSLGQVATDITPWAIQC